MAEVVGLVASIVQIAGAGCQLSSALYNYTTSAVRADQDIADIAGDVELTSNALESVGRVFETEEAKSVVSKKAIQDANNLIKRCDAVFKDISELVDKRRKVSKDGKKGLSVMGKLSWPMKEQRLELHRRRLDSLKNSLVLLLHVLQLAQGQARGQLEKDALEIEREKIRELHQRQQESLKCLQALENKLSKVALDDEETLQGSAPPSRVPTLELMFGASSATTLGAKTIDEEDPKPNVLTIDLLVPDSDTSESDGATTDDDEGEHLSLEDLEKASKHVQKLLKRITVLQKSFDGGHKTKVHKKKHVHKMYARFRKSWETHLGPISIATLPTQTPLSGPVLAPPPEPPLFPSHDNHLFASKTVELNGRAGYPSPDTGILTFSQGLDTSRSGYNSCSSLPKHLAIFPPSSANSSMFSGMRSQTQAAPDTSANEKERAASGPPGQAHNLMHIEPPIAHLPSLFPFTNISVGVSNAPSESTSDQQAGTATSAPVKEAGNQQLKRDTSSFDFMIGQTDSKVSILSTKKLKKSMAVPRPPLHELLAQQQQMARDWQIAKESAQTQVQVHSHQQVQAQNSVQMEQQRAQPDTTSPSLLQGSADSLEPHEQELPSNISDDAQLRKIRSRIAQRDYRKQLKKRMEDLDRRAASGPASPERNPVGLQNLQLPPRHEASNMIGLEPVHPYPSAEDRMFSHQYTRQLSASPKPATQQAQREFSPHSHGYFVSRIEELVAANMPYAHMSQTPSAADWNEPWLQQRKSPDSQSGHASLAGQTAWTAPNRAEHPSHQALSEQHQVYHDNGQGNHALQDYNMQLMLLEQQNKKRLLMARQGQDDLVVERKRGRGDASDRAAGRMSPGYPSAPIPGQANSQNMKRGTEILSQPKDVDQIRGHSDLSQTRSERGQPKPVSPNKFAPRDTHGEAEFDGDKSRQVPDMGLSDHAFDLSFGLDEHSALENFDFDSFLQSDQDVAENNVWFGKGESVRIRAWQISNAVDFDSSNVASPGKSKEKAEGIAAEGDNKMGDMADASSPVQSAFFSGEVLQFSEDVVSPDPGWVPYQQKPRLVIPESTTGRTRGRRKGLTAEQRSNAALLRATGACQNCKNRKERCDGATPCRPCLKRRKWNPDLAPCRGQPWDVVRSNSEGTAKFAGGGPPDASTTVDIHQQTSLVVGGNSNAVHPALEHQVVHPGPATWPNSDSLAQLRSMSSHPSLEATKYPGQVEREAEFCDESDDEDYKNSLRAHNQPGFRRRRNIFDYPNPIAAPAIALDTGEDMLGDRDETKSEGATSTSAVAKSRAHTPTVPDQVANKDGDFNVNLIARSQSPGSPGFEKRWELEKPMARSPEDNGPREDGAGEDHEHVTPRAGMNDAVIARRLKRQRSWSPRDRERRRSRVRPDLPIAGTPGGLVASRYAQRSPPGSVSRSRLQTRSRSASPAVASNLQQDRYQVSIDPREKRTRCKGSDRSRDQSPVVQDVPLANPESVDEKQHSLTTSVPTIEVPAFISRIAPQGKKKRARGPFPPPEVLGSGILSPSPPPAPPLSYPPPLPPLPPIESYATLSTFDESGLKSGAARADHFSDSIDFNLLPSESRDDGGEDSSGLCDISSPSESRDDGEDDSIWPDSDQGSSSGTEICERLHQPVRRLKRKRMASEAVSGNKRMKVDRLRSASTRSSRTVKESSPPQSGRRDIVDILLEEWTVLVG